MEDKLVTQTGSSQASNCLTCSSLLGTWTDVLLRLSAANWSFCERQEWLQHTLLLWLRYIQPPSPHPALHPEQSLSSSALFVLCLWVLINTLNHRVRWENWQLTRGKDENSFTRLCSCLTQLEPMCGAFTSMEETRRSRQRRSGYQRMRVCGWWGAEVIRRILLWSFLCALSFNSDFPVCQ